MQIEEDKFRKTGLNAENVVFSLKNFLNVNIFHQVGKNFENKIQG